jgi:choline dehydrogenase-like flavoprotein
MIYDASQLTCPLEIRADICVVGSGAGGSAAATIAAEAGKTVVVLEAGSFITPKKMTQREEQMLPQLLWEAGGRSTADRAVRIHQGRAVGGSTMHNLNLCARIPAPIRRSWSAHRGMKYLPEERWEVLYAEVEAILGVSEIPAALRNRHNSLLLHGCRELGWKGGALRHNRSGCLGSGYCLLGCMYDAKNNALKMLLPRLVAAGGEVLTNCQAIVVEHDGGQVRGVRAAAMDPISRRPMGTVRVQAQTVCLAASATGTPAILLRSSVPDPSGSTGRSLRVHPALLAAGEFDEPVRAWEGIPQSVECTELLDFERAHPPDGGAEPAGVARTWIVPAFAHPVGTATMVPGLGGEHRTLMESYERLAVFTSMLHDRTSGRVRPRGDFGIRIDYWPDEADRRELTAGLAACARLLFASGARRVHVPTTPLQSYERSDSLGPLDTLELSPGTLDITAVHPMGSVPMGDDPERAAVGSDGRHHHLNGLWVADGSLFPSSIGVPPQLSIYAMGLHVGRALTSRSALQ